MKRIAIIALLAVFLTTNYAYATLTTDDLARGVEKAQQGELTQEEAEELLIRLISSVDLEEVMAGDLGSIESIVQPNQSTECIVLLIITTLVTIFYAPLAPVFAALSAYFCS
jgi:hypothetical protein